MVWSGALLVNSTTGVQGQILPKIDVVSDWAIVKMGVTQLKIEEVC